MYIKSLQNKKILLKLINDDFYLIKNSIILDETCPECKNLIFEDKAFCECGFYIKAALNSVFWSRIIAIWVIVGLFCLVGLIKLDEIKKNGIAYSHNIDFNNLSPVNVQVMTSLKNSPYYDYIQNVYTKTGDNNKLSILIKPALWNILSSKEKQDLTDQAKKNWKIIYTRNYPDSKKQTSVSFANLE
jgi:hypothetical protein